MIKATVTKNIMKKANNSLGITPRQIIITAIAFAIGVIMYIGLKNLVNLKILSTLIFIELSGIIGFGVITMQGMSLAQFFIKTLKGVDVRYYETKGVYSNDIQEQ